MSGRTFVDTNVFVYLFDAGAPEKKATAQRLLDAGAEAGRLVLSTQVLEEFYVTVTRKLANPLSEDDAQEATRALAGLPVVQVDPEMIDAAISLSRHQSLSFWDALVVRAAVAAGCERLLSEDLQDGQEIEGVRVENPFLTPRSFFAPGRPS